MRRASLTGVPAAGARLYEIPARDHLHLLKPSQRLKKGIADSFRRRLCRLRCLQFRLDHIPVFLNGRFPYGKVFDADTCTCDRKGKRGFIDVGGVGAGVFDLLNSWGYAFDPATPSDLCKEPAFAVEHSLQVRKLLPSSVEFPVGHAMSVR